MPLIVIAELFPPYWEKEKKKLGISIRTNIAALKAQRQLSNATDRLSSTYERLSSGQRINHASDDAAGLAIADSLKTEKRLLTTSIRNMSDGVSALSIAEAALDSQNELLTRMSELAEQAANGSLSSTQRQTLQNEYTLLGQEFGRIAAATKFNNITLLHGAKRGGIDYLQLQAGIDGSSSSQLRIAIGDSGQFSGILNRSSVNFISSDISGLTDATIESLQGIYGAALFKITNDAYVGAREDSSFGSFAFSLYRKNSNGSYDETAFSYATFNSVTGEINASSVSSLTTEGVDLRALKLSDSNGQYAPNLGSSTNIEFTSIDTQTRARVALDTIARRREALSTQKGIIGAGESRLRVATSVNQTIALEVGASESRIRDVDIASETAALVATQIRQSIAAELLGKVNLEPNLVLSLLR